MIVNTVFFKFKKIKIINFNTFELPKTIINFYILSFLIMIHFSYHFVIKNTFWRLFITKLAVIAPRNA